MSFLQKVFRAILPTSWSAAMESESRTWVLRCPCGYETSVWEMGGIRYKAAGRPWRTALCAKCKRLVTGTLYRTTEARPPGETA